MNDIVILASEPLESFLPDDVKVWLEKNYSEQHLADAFAGVSNKTTWLMHDADEDLTVLEKLEKWHELYEELYSKIFEILKEENISKNTHHILEGGTHYIVKPFMEKYGYRDGSGWWVEKEE